MSLTTLSARALAADVAAVVLAEQYDSVEPRVVAIEGSIEEWHTLAPFASLLCNAPVITLGICPAAEAGADLPEALRSCDLHVLLGDAADGVPVRSRVVGTLDEARAWVMSLEASVRSAGAPALTAAQTLRLTARLPVAEALVVESLAYSMLQAGPAHRKWLERRAS